MHKNSKPEILHLMILNKSLLSLSYGDENYAKEVIVYGKRLFGDKFVPITEFMPFEKYIEFLSTIDIAIFAHKRQQAFGNIITLLGMGKKVYLNPKSTLYSLLLHEYDILVFDYNNFNLQLLEESINRKI